MNCPNCGFIFDLAPLLPDRVYALHVASGRLTPEQLTTMRDHLKTLENGLGVKIIVVEAGAQLKEAPQ